MASLADKMREYAAGHQVPYDAAHWDQMCGSLMYRFNDWMGWASGPRGDISSARRAAMGSGLLNGNAAACPVGGFHFFDIAGINNGHVGMDATGGGRAVFMATWSVTEDLGRAIGFLSVAGYLAAKAGRVTYLGWSMNYSGGIPSLAGLTGGSTASTGTTDLKDEDMPLTEAEWKRIDLANEGANLTLLKRIGEVVWNAQLTHSNGVKEPAVKWLLNTSDMVGKIDPGSVVDVDKLAAAIVAKLPKVTGAPSAVEIVAALKAAL